MPKGKKRGAKKDARKSLSRVDSIMEKIKFRNAKEREEVRRALESVLGSPHIAGITKTVPSISYDRDPLKGNYPLFGKGRYVFKISISTTKTRKTFGIRA